MLIRKASPPDKSQLIGPNEFKYTVQWAEPHCYMIAPSGLFLTFSLSHTLLNGLNPIAIEIAPSGLYSKVEHSTSIVQPFNISTHH